MWARGYQAPPGAVFHECHSGLKASTDILHLGGFLLSSKTLYLSFRLSPGYPYRLHVSLVFGKKNSSWQVLQELRANPSVANQRKTTVLEICSTGSYHCTAWLFIFMCFFPPKSTSYPEVTALYFTFLQFYFMTLAPISWQNDPLEGKLEC